MIKIIKFGDIEIQKQKLHQHKRPISIKNIDINKIVVSNKVSFGRKFRNLIGYKDAKKVDLYVYFSQKSMHIEETLIKLKSRPLCIFLPKMHAYRRDFDQTKYICFLTKDYELLEKHNEIQQNFKTSIKKEFDSEPVYNKKYLKAKIKSYNEKLNTNFRNNKIPREGSQFICLSVILIDSVLRTGRNYYPQVF